MLSFSKRLSSAKNKPLKAKRKMVLHHSFTKNEYIFRKKFLKLFGGAFHVYDSSGNVVFFSKQKAFKLKEDFTVYADESMQKDLLTIKADRVVDISAEYRVVDSTTGEDVGTIKRKGLKSILKDQWTIRGKKSEKTATLIEESTLGAILSRFINLVPQKYVIKDDSGMELATIRQHFNPFILKYSMSMLDGRNSIDPRLLIAMGIMISSIEGRQE